MKTPAKIGLIGAVLLITGLGIFMLTNKGQAFFKKITSGSTGSPAVNSGTFDWVGKGDYNGRNNFYAAPHILDFVQADIKVGETLMLSKLTNWDEMEGKTAKVLKLNFEQGTAILDVPAPAGDASGVWSRA